MAYWPQQSIVRSYVLGLLSMLLVPLGYSAELRFWSLTDVTRIAIPTDGEAPIHSDRLINPDRVFFDLHTTKPLANRRKMQTLEVGDAIVRQIRLAETQPGITRVVIDLKGPAQFSVAQLGNPDRVIIELRRPAGMTVLPMAALQPPVAAPVTRSLSKVRTYLPPFARRIRLEAPVVLPAPEGLRLVASVSRVEDLPRLAPPPTLPRWTAATTSRLRAKVNPVRPSTRPLPRESESAFVAKRTSEGDRTLARVLGLKLTRVVIDAGHGGHDVGTSGPGGLQEKDLVLDVAKRLGVLVAQRMGSEVVYTRSDDTFVPLEMRTQIANSQKADLFLSIHANSSPAKTASGVETYYLNFTTSQEALDVAARENVTARSTLYDLNDLVKKIALKDKVDESREFAAQIQASLFSQASRSNPRATDRGVRKAPFVVLIGAQMPSVLAEIGFVSNPRDEAQLKKPEARQKIAEALFKGLSQYAETLSHFQVARQTVP